ncbi:MAG: hypothetical protein SF052_22610 [Bacteroidia bacterium]|nr:hypothetical protein [Bacteroidia bacterium]
MLLEQLEKTLNENPRTLFLIDGVGAIVSAFLLGVVLVRWERVFGIPAPTLYLLASLPVLFAVYDFYCYQTQKEKPGVFLRTIALANLLYCLLSMGFAFYHFPTITIWGGAYILSEILIVVLLAMLELRLAKRH